MEQLIVQGGQRLKGEIDVQGAKNSALPILAATLLYGGKTTLHNCPKLLDVDAAIKILKYLGCKVSQEDNGNTLFIDSTSINQNEIPQELMHEMRSSIVFLGAIISRLNKAKMFYPGGCELGPRPIDLHISSLKRLGVTIIEEFGCLTCEATNGIKGSKINLSFPSVGATENIMLASVMAKGETIIVNAAQEPEIVDLANYLISRGAKIRDAGKSTVIIEGVDKLESTEYRVMPDRIVVATYLCCAGITGGNIKINNINPCDIESVLPIFEQAGCQYKLGEKSIDFVGPAIIKPVKNIRTMPYPGFPTDAQAPIMTMLTLANGTAVFVENIFENRYKHVCELCRMGADIKI
ncbi:MAG: UDP-N-acetylglucosamine 1-carboxyvinyltransferase, partial [Oscillospiraceae bacterium]